MSKKVLMMIFVVVALTLVIGITRITLRKNHTPSNLEGGTNDEEVNSSGEVNKIEAKVVTLTSKNYEEEVLKSQKTVVIEFGATWCEDCKVQDPIIDEISAEYDNVKIARVDIDEEQELKEYFGISAIPTIAIIKEGKISRKVVGIANKEKIMDLINY